MHNLNGSDILMRSMNLAGMPVKISSLLSVSLGRGVNLFR